MKPYRTVLFVPAHKTSWFDKAAAAGADSICFDLEDSVPPQLKESARTELEEKLATIEQQRLAIRDLSTPIIELWDNIGRNYNRVLKK